ncbi:hypothetical protein N288_23120 [Bacillus infantis NRRL B-14911]|uniref:Uncharacterized protein n=1 Tax=Bacillus infantis NRRL B-14911 TaxID=1367477 RepID=U5LGB5_9BACI|nr:hypothetical protein N288_23120 [Bacillus infantis NRRL B-14911]
METETILCTMQFLHYIFDGDFQRENYVVGNKAIRMKNVEHYSAGIFQNQVNEQRIYI